MGRKRLLYFSLLVAALLLFGLAALLTPHLRGEDIGVLALLRFVVLCLGIGSTIGSWFTAVTIASVHKKTWPLFVTVTLVVAGLLFATACISGPPPQP